VSQKPAVTRGWRTFWNTVYCICIHTATNWRYCTAQNQPNSTVSTNPFISKKVMVRHHQ